MIKCGHFRTDFFLYGADFHINASQPTHITIQTDKVLIQIEIIKETVYRNSKGVAVWDFIVYNGLNVDGLQLEVDCYIDQPGDRCKTQRCADNSICTENTI